MLTKEIFQVEHKMIELKARVDDLDSLRKKIIDLESRFLGTFNQTDTYFVVPQGRLKLREVQNEEGMSSVELIYYDREDIAGPKKCEVFISILQEPEYLLSLLERLLEKNTIVEKVREIYRYQIPQDAAKHKYVQIHLDNVKKLGTFIEFEIKTSKKRESGDKQVLNELMRKLEIRPNQLEKSSYSDIYRETR